MHGLHLAVAFSNTSRELIWMILMVTFGLSGIAMLIFAKPFERFSYRYPLWNRGESHSARFYRIMGDDATPPEACPRPELLRECGEVRPAIHLMRRARCP
jgi:hypothetical protein